MNQSTRNAIGAIALAAIAPLVHAAGATAPYNEAVRMVDGKKVVEVMPLPPNYRKNFPASLKKPGEVGARTVLTAIETPKGLMDCSILWYAPEACVPSTFGKVKTFREWQVKLNGTWQRCIGREKPVTCIPYGSRRLQALPVMEE